MSLEYILGNYLKDEMISYILSHPVDVDELIELALSDNQPHSARAAWLLSHCFENYKVRLIKHLPVMINTLKNINGGQQRDLIYILRQMELNEEQEGLLFDISIEIWSKLNNISSVRYNALIFIVQVAKKYPELYNEVILLTQDFYMESLSKGIKRAAQQLIDSYKDQCNSD